jgi:hypothetical protein
VADVNVFQLPIRVDDTGRPHRHWSGRTEAAKVLRAHVNVGDNWLTPDEATDIAEAMLKVYLEAQR